MELKTLSSFLFSRKGGAGWSLIISIKDLEVSIFILCKILVTGEQFKKTISSDVKFYMHVYLII